VVLRGEKMQQKKPQAQNALTAFSQIHNEHCNKTLSATRLTSFATTHFG
jgi:hypothetical protein